MTDITAERKLELIRCIREEHNRNRNSLRSRERILYGRSSEAYETGTNKIMHASDYYSEKDMLTNDENAGNTPVFSGLWIRTLLATMLFAFYIILDFTKGSVMDMDANEIHACISKNYTSNVIDFMEEITYTLEDTGSTLTR